MHTTPSVFIHKIGSPDVLRFQNTPIPTPKPFEVLLRQEAIGLNFIDVYHRTGLYPLSLPSILGQEGAGIVESVGRQVTLFQKGDRVAYAAGPVGAYAKWRTYPEAQLIKLPDEIDLQTAAAMMLQGLTSAFLLHKAYAVKAGETVLIHAAAGGVGSIACQWAKALGARVIGTVSTEAKADFAKKNGVDHLIFYKEEDVAEQVRKITSGEGVSVVYDGVGKATFTGSLNSLRVRGTLVSFGNASGALAPISPLMLAEKGSLFLTRSRLSDYIAKREEMLALAQALFDQVRRGKIKIHIKQSFPLSEVQAAHRMLEARQTMGASLLIP